MKCKTLRKVIPVEIINKCLKDDEYNARQAVMNVLGDKKIIFFCTQKEAENY